MTVRTAHAKSFESARTRDFTESVIREMTRLAVQYGATNLAQGFPDFASPPELKQAAVEAILADHNQYSITWGAKKFRDAIARKYHRTYGLEPDPEREITVCCGATEGMIAALLAVTDPGDEVIVFEPFYENYYPDSLICGVERKLVTLRAPDWTFDPEELRAAFSERTKAIILNTPNNPTGKVFTREELTVIAGLCQEFDALAITDEIYEHITYGGKRHIPIITMPGMRDRSILINSMSKTFSVTGWRVGWAIASPALTNTIRKVHDFLTVHAPTPLQMAGVVALDLPDSYFEKLAADYDARRRIAVGMLQNAGFHCFLPDGAYYVMTDARHLGVTDDRAFAEWLVREIGVAAVPGSSFYSSDQGNTQLRFCFCKKPETLEEAGRKLAKVPASIASYYESTKG
ncbi:MAG TPA: aminotransferase class I/II-fold pyridoxal phosphate-dependent enzyme [Bryobacteraceae bacterium]|nr:aminotransferase class I/II-fold pyridoxal phosphate-dependent enzyme [Bryobacteraceae bacterium]